MSHFITQKNSHFLSYSRSLSDHFDPDQKLQHKILIKITGDF